MVDRVIARNGSLELHSVDEETGYVVDTSTGQKFEKHLISSILAKGIWDLTGDTPDRIRVVIKGGKGSGFHGHAGRPGKVGGSSAGTVSLDEAAELWFDFEMASAAKAHSRGEDIENYYTTGGEKLSAEDVEKAKSMAGVLQDAASTMTTSYKKIYRGQAYLSEDDLNKEFPKGKYVELSSLTAASPDPKIASIYHDVQYVGGEGISVLFHIENPTGIIGYERDSGLEIILPKGARYRNVRQWLDNEGIINVTLYSTEKLGKRKKTVVKKTLSS